MHQERHLGNSVNDRLIASIFKAVFIIDNVFNDNICNYSNK